jgi:hypothetical protein
VFVQRAVGEAPALFRVNLATGRRSKFADAANPAVSPGGTRIATLGSAGLELGPPVASGLGAPAFLDENTLVALANCCIGNQRLVSIDLRSGRRKPFAVVPGPPETIRRLRDGVLLVVTASNKLMVVSHNHKKVVASRVTGADR